jgi:hypothetical protein
LPGVRKPSTSGAAKISRSRAKPALSEDGSAANGRRQQKEWKTALPDTVLPLGMRLKQVIDFLRQRETAASVAEISAATGRQVDREEDLASALEVNPKVMIDAVENTLIYVPDANIRDKNQLLDYVLRSGAPVAVKELADSYKAVMDDVATLKAEGKIVGLHSYDPEVACEVLYPVDQSLAGLAADSEVTAVWYATEIPEDDEETAAGLRSFGQVPAPRKAPRKKEKSTENKKRKKRSVRLRAVTNVHLIHLIEGEGPATIDALD